MRIENIETFIVTNWLVVRITADDGTQGIGESTFWAFPKASETIVKAFAEDLVGEDPLRVEHHWQYMYRKYSFRGGRLGHGRGAGYRRWIHRAIVRVIRRPAQKARP